MKKIIRWAVALSLAFAASAASAAISCSSITGSASATVTNVFAGGNIDVSGAISFTCTRAAGDPKFPATFYIGTSGTNGSRNLSNGGNTLAYQLFTAYPGCSAAWQNTGTDISVANSLTAGGDRTTSFSNIPFCLRVTPANTTKPLVFSASETLTIRSASGGGTSYGTGTLSVSGTVNALCLTTTGNTLLFNYTSFQSSAQPGTNGTFVVQCTNTTSFSLSLDAVTGTAAGLTYNLGLTSVGTQNLNSQSGTGNTVTYQVPGSIPAGQAGTCATGATCVGNDSRTVTITY
ncbi:spore coat protein U domain-containing protein [Ramlibacter albus]|uniref:Spore coat protein U domain-containing protein n=1 Tax=Ramlibacter albus TaxID=2079448 RepID=A0A923M4K1_9BURK|nr:spore coat protein U domain-containing protein [Ramlibacter albus]MBC5763270.1 spore coat protein U domain-containing protein [Ramlibacter albus]